MKPTRMSAPPPAGGPLQGTRRTAQPLSYVTLRCDNDGGDVTAESEPSTRQRPDSLLDDDNQQPDPAAAPAAAAEPPRIPWSVSSLLFLAALVQAFSSGCISLYINKDLAFGPVEVTRYWMFIGLTVWLQPLLGGLSDSLVICNERRRPLFVLSAIGSAVIFSLFAVARERTGSYHAFVVLSTVNQLFIMGQYIPLNGMIVELGKDGSETAEKSVTRMSGVMSQAMTIRSVGSLASSLLQVIALLLVSVKALIVITAALYAALAVLILCADRSLFVNHRRHEGESETGSGDPSACKRAEETYERVKDSFDIRDVRSDGFSFILVLLFVFFYTLMPDAGSVYYNYLYGAFSFSTWFYSLNNLIGSVGSTVGAYAFSLWMAQRARHEALGRRSARTSIFFLFCVGCVTWALAYLTNLMLCTGLVTDVLGIPAKVFIPIDTFFVAVCVRFAFMPTLIMAAEHAPKDFEATAFEVFSVASIGGGTLSSLLTSFIAEGMRITREDYSNLWLLLLLSIVCKLLPVPVAYFLPEQRASREGEAVDVRVEGVVVDGTNSAAV